MKTKRTYWRDYKSSGRVRSRMPARVVESVLVGMILTFTSSLRVDPVLATPAAAGAGLTAAEEATIELFRRASRSVVYITSITLRRDWFDLNVYEIPRGTGSGFVWDAKGRIVTNYHVLQGANAAQVTLQDQSVWDSKVIGVAPEKDLAVLEIAAPPDSLHPITVGSSADLQVGQSVLAIGPGSVGPVAMSMVV